MHKQKHHPSKLAVVLMLLPSCLLRTGSVFPHASASPSRVAGSLVVVSGQRRPVVSTRPLRLERDELNSSLTGYANRIARTLGREQYPIGYLKNGCLAGFRWAAGLRSCMSFTLTSAGRCFAMAFSSTEYGLDMFRIFAKRTGIYR